MNNEENEARYAFYTNVLNGILEHLKDEDSFQGTHFYIVEVMKILTKLNDIKERDLCDEKTNIL